MRLSLHEILAIVGHLDDAPGFDTPRERFRRFLLEHMTSAGVALTFLGEAQHLISEQYQRALQDTLAAAGQILGFEVLFGSYDRHGAAARHVGAWRARRRLIVDVRLFADDAATDSGALARSFPPQSLEVEPETPRARLAVVAAACGSRPRIDALVVARHLPARTMSLGSLTRLIALAASSHVGRDDVLGLFGPGPSLDELVAFVGASAERMRPTPPVAAPPRVPSGPAHWAYVARDQEADVTPEMAPTVLTAAAHAGDPPPVSAGDLVAILVPTQGVVAQASAAGIVGPQVHEPAEPRETYTINLGDVVVFESPRLVDTLQRLNLELQAAVAQEPWVRVTRAEFDALVGVSTAPQAEPHDAG
jgi:hypothetical protein